MEKYTTHYENECYMLCMFILDNTLIGETRLRDKHFLNDNNRYLFKIMKELRDEEKQVDIMSLHQLGDDRKAMFGGWNTVSNIYGLTNSCHNFNFIQQKMIEFIAIDDVLHIVESFKDKTKFSHSSTQLNELLSKINDVQIDTVKPQHSFRDKLQLRIEQHSNMPVNGLSGASTGFKSLNNALDGWQPGELIVVAARPSVGKTAFVLDTMRKGAAEDKDYMGTFFSCEMVDEKIVDRWIAMEGSLPVAAMTNPNKFFGGRAELWDKYNKACGSLSELPIDVRPEKNINEIRAVIRKKVKEFPDKKHVFAIDHLGHVGTDERFDSNHLKFTHIMNQLKDIQKEFKVAIILVAQLNRAVEGKQDKAPSMSDIRESGSIEEIADVIIFPHRPAYFDREQREKEKIHEVELIIAKNRNGFVGSLGFSFVPKTNLFFERGA